MFFRILKVFGYVLMVVGGIAMLCGLYLMMPWMCDAGKTESRAIALLMAIGAAIFLLGNRLTQ